MPDHTQIVTEVERQAVAYVGDIHAGMRDGLLRLWRDFASTKTLSRTKKPETWVAGLVYTFDRMQFAGMSQGDAANAFSVSEPSVSLKFREISAALDLTLLDPRYLPEGIRAAVRRDMPNLPENLPLADAPTSFWHVPFDMQMLSGARPSDSALAQDLIYTGWQAMSTDEAEAEAAFRRAIALDPLLADAYNGLAFLADTAAEAETLSRRAYDLARDALYSESPEAYAWWGQLETRPYMRAREGLAMALAAQGRHREAAAEYEALLRLNPRDNQGVRFLLAPEYLLARDREAALDAFARHVEAYPTDMGDADHTFLHGLVLWADGRREDAIRMWSRAIFQNLYVAPAILGKPFPPTDLWHGTNLAVPQVSERHLASYESIWTRHPKARTALGRLWRDPEIIARVETSVRLGQEMKRLSDARSAGADFDAENWKALVHERWGLVKKPLPDAVVRRLVGA